MTEQLTFRKPERIFEKSGAVNPGESYHVHLENVVNTDNQDIKTMVDRGRYFSIFAPRQSGKTTFLEDMCSRLHKNPMYAAVLLDFQEYAALSREKFYAQVQKKLYRQLIERLTALDCEKLDEITSHLDRHRLTDHISFGELFEELNRIIEHKKIVIFIDEFDGIPRDELANFLTTLRSLYLEYKKKKQKALYSVGLIGIRNIVKLVVGGVSPFNIADQVDLPPFSLKNVRDLYSQYSEETNQPFTEAAVKKVYRETAGQPWLVNRLGTILTVNIKPGTVEPIDEQDVQEAMEMLLIERNSHFDNLYEKAKVYKETFVEIVFDGVEYNPDNEDHTWLEQYGLIKKKDKKAAAANPIYKARYTKAFFKEAKVYEEKNPESYTRPGDRLDMERILFDFEQYIAQIGARAFYEKRKIPGDDPGEEEIIIPYERTGQFLLTAWLYQFVRGGAGELRYEVHTGLGRMDILLTYKNRKYIIETKVNRHKLSRILSDGVSQLTDRYLGPEKADEGYLVVFDIKTPAGNFCEPQNRQTAGKKITCIVIGIGREKAQL